MLKKFLYNILIGTGTYLSSAALQINSTTKGVLFPRMTTTQRLSISSPAVGLFVFDTDFGAFFYYAGTLLGWVNIATLIPETPQTHSIGATVTVGSDKSMLVVNPVNLLPALTITLPATPLDGQTLNIQFGGSITSGKVVSSLILPNTVLGRKVYSNIWTGDFITLKYDAVFSIWRTVGFRYQENRQAIRRIATNTTATIYDYTLVCTDTLTVTLPQSSTCEGLILNIKNRASATKRITISTQAGDSLDNNTPILYNNSLMLQSDGISEWIKI